MTSMDVRRTLVCIVSVIACGACAGAVGAHVDDETAAAPDASPGLEPEAGADGEATKRADAAADRNRDASAQPDAPVRPQPGPTVRVCGTTPTVRAIDARTGWASFGAAPLGVGFYVEGREGSLPTIGQTPWGTGAIARVSVATSGGSTNAPDVGPDQIAGALSGGHRNFQSTPTKYWQTPDTQTLTYASFWWNDEVAWTLDDAAASAAAPTNAINEYVSWIGPLRFYGFQLTLRFTSPCSVGALSDVLGRPAFVRDATGGNGIFEPAKRSAIERVLVDNGAYLYLRVEGNKERASTNALLATTKCATNDLTACEALVQSLAAEQLAVVNDGAPSDASALQNDTDPRWSVATFGTSPVTILKR